MTVEVLEIFTDTTLVVTNEVAPDLEIFDTVSKIQTLELGLIGPQGATGAKGDPGAGAFPSTDAGNVAGLGSDQGFYVPTQMVWTSTNW